MGDKKPYSAPELRKLDPSEIRHALTDQDAPEPVRESALTFPVMGHRNPIICMQRLIDQMDDETAMADEQSFAEVAEIVGDLPDDVLAERGFVCDHFYSAMPILASLANVRVIANAGVISVELMPDDPRARG